jgi:hypothetical protein
VYHIVHKSLGKIGLFQSFQIGHLVSILFEVQVLAAAFLEFNDK